MTRKKQYRDSKFIAAVAKEISHICKEQKISHEVLSARTGFDTRQVGRILRGENNFSISHFAQVCRGIGVHPTKILANVDLGIDEVTTQ